jgi:Xaa-Pro aminopeptidase
MPKAPSSPPPARLLYENSANWRYAVNEPIGDPALWYQTSKGKTHALVNELEYGHLLGAAQVDKLHNYAMAKKALKGEPLTFLNLVKYLMAQDKVAPAALEVPHNFPSRLYAQLQAAKLPVRVAEGELFFPNRAMKSAAEIKKIHIAQALNEQVIEHALHILAEAEIARDKKLIWQSKPLTSEILRGEMNALAARFGATEFGGGPIVAGGAQGATPHDRGHGVLKAHQFIVIDSFPRHANGYWGDCTRTVLKGTPSNWHKEVYFAVLEAQNLALKLLKPGVDGRDIHQAVQSFFTKVGFPTGTDDKGRPYGFFHGTGHGVGLELHDPGPRTISTVSCPLQAGMVTSVEPGLYYPTKGGVRLEDVGVVTATGFKNFNKLSKTAWVID